LEATPLPPAKDTGKKKLGSTILQRISVRLEV
jgi:hypothetical protein